MAKNQTASVNPWGELPKEIEVPIGNFMQFNKIYDGVAGTVTKIINDVYNKKLKRQEDQIEVLVTHGFYHDKVGNKVELETGQTVVMGFKRNPRSPITLKAAQLKVGQIAAFIFTEEIDTGEVNPFKNIKIHSDGVMDEEWLKMNAPASMEEAKKIFGGEVV